MASNRLGSASMLEMVITMMIIPILVTLVGIITDVNNVFDMKAPLPNYMIGLTSR